MPKGPQGPNRPADAIGCAVMVAQLATGELTETIKKQSGRVKSGKTGSMALFEKLSSVECQTIAYNAAGARW